MHGLYEYGAPHGGPLDHQSSAKRCNHAFTRQVYQENIMVKTAKKVILNLLPGK